MPTDVHYPLNTEELRTKIYGIRKGAKVLVTPRMMEDREPYNAFGIPCGSGERKVVELAEPFYAYLENFDGEVVWIRTVEYFCLKISVEDLKEVSVLVNSPWGTANSVE